MDIDIVIKIRTLPDGSVSTEVSSAEVPVNVPDTDPALQVFSYLVHGLTDIIFSMQHNPKLPGEHHVQSESVLGSPGKNIAG